MSKTDPTVENLMKVSVDMEPTEPSSQKAQRLSFEFIFGVGPAGITPFEKALFGKTVGDSVYLDMTSAEYCHAVGHLELPLREQTGLRTPTPMKITVTDIVRAQDREVVKAMAAGGSCSDCGCGCGGH